MDLIIYNAVIYTVDSKFTIAQSAAVKDGKFAAVGSDREILGKYRASAVIDMQGRFVWPGFIDPHCHLYGYGSNLMYADLTGARSYEEVIERIREHDSRFPGEWILGRGWDQNLWPGQAYPGKEPLDKVFPGKPVLLTRIDTHAAVANSEALRRARIDPSLAIEGGEIIRDGGEPTGLLIDNAIGLVRKHVPEPGYESKVTALMNAQRNCFSVGLTSVGDAGLDHDVIKLMDSLHRSGDLKMRVYAMLNPSSENFATYMHRGIYKTSHLNVRSVKLFADGALGSRGARLIDEYSDHKGNSGLLVVAPEYLAKISEEARDFGYQVNTHCIGDAAVRLVLGIYGNLLGGKNDRRWRIEHAQMVHPDDLPLFKRYSVVPSVQAVHAMSDMKWAIHRIGPGRMKYSYALKDLLEHSGWLTNGSDFPVEHINPLRGFHAAVARKDPEGYPREGFQAENALTREQALRAMTIWAARAAFEEHEKGSIEPGKFADFTVTEEDLMQMDMDGVPDLKINSTYIAGEKVYPAGEYD
ncbi:MAG: amidohydrolase [Marinilabiliales bacterium]|nr:MAG: amidohydrolase [Marinilabiliales bacterium]